MSHRAVSGRARRRHLDRMRGGGREPRRRHAGHCGNRRSESRGIKRGVVVNLDAAVDSIKKAIEEAELMAASRSIPFTWRFQGRTSRGSTAAA